MANVVVVGAQWGDEGKGKIVDWLSERADVIARFQGGHNAGHTLVIDGKVYKLSLLPSGIVRGGKLSVIGNGVVVDPWHLVSEIEKLRGQGVEITPDNLMLAENASLILPIHGELDRGREAQTSVAKIGTTGRGIGPAYEDKVGRRAIRVADIFDAVTLDTRIGRLLQHHNALRAGLGLEPVDPAALKAQILEIAPKIKPYSGPVWKVLTEARRAGKRILFEGAQGMPAGHRFRHLSLCHVLEHHRGSGCDRHGAWPDGDRFRAGHRQGLYHARRRRPVPRRTARRRWRTAG